MSIRVGRVTTGAYGRWNMEKLDGYESIIPLTESTPHYQLSPYYLKNSKGFIMENIWQFSKVYEDIPVATWKPPKNTTDKTISHPAETHITDGKVNKNYWKWRSKGFKCPYPVRYPVGFNHRHKCLYALKSKKHMKQLGYIESRKKIYLPIYQKLAKREKMFWDILEKVQNGKNILIFDVDGPHQESLEYYKKKYKIKNDFIQNNSVDVSDKKAMKILLDDEKHPFGHGYCLALALLKELNKK